MTVMPKYPDWIHNLKFNSKGLIPVVTQDVHTKDVLMMAWANNEALYATVTQQLAVYWSRSRQQLWQKGETSGHIQKLHEIRIDCDADTVLYIVEQIGLACHTNRPTCFFQHVEQFATTHTTQKQQIHYDYVLNKLEAVIQSRKQSDTKTSYVAKLMAKGNEGIGKKVLEESLELILAGEKNDNTAAQLEEACDVLFHFLVHLSYHNCSISDVLAVLQKRFGISGITEKENR